MVTVRLKKSNILRPITVSVTPEMLEVFNEFDETQDISIQSNLKSEKIIK